MLPLLHQITTIFPFCIIVLINFGFILFLRRTHVISDRLCLYIIGIEIEKAALKPLLSFINLFLFTFKVLFDGHGELLREEAEAAPLVVNGDELTLHGVALFIAELAKQYTAYPPLH